MQIGIIGAGKMGGTLGKLWAAKGHVVMFGSRDPAKAKVQAAELSGADGGSIDEAAAFGQVVLLGVPWRAAIETVTRLGPALKGKTLIDMTNPIGDGMTLALGHTTSLAEEIAATVPAAKVVKAFNGIHFSLLEKPVFSGFKADVFYCGDDAEAKALVAQLIIDTGFEPVEAGPLHNARLLEPLANLWMQLAYVNGRGTEMAFKLLPR